VYTWGNNVPHQQTKKKVRADIFAEVEKGGSKKKLKKRGTQKETSGSLQDRKAKKQTRVKPARVNGSPEDAVKKQALGVRGGRVGSYT